MTEMSDHTASVQAPAVMEPKPKPVNKPKLHRYKFTFHGDAKTFFNIWVVNTLLTILTLGVYSAWAKVRQTRYLYGSMEFAGSRFEYRAQPLAILRGRLIALVLVTPYVYFSYVNPQWAAFILFGIFLVSPFLIVLAMRFRMHNTAYRNIRFRFTATMLKGYYYFGIVYLLGILTLGLALPGLIKQQNEFKYKSIAWGYHHFEVKASYLFFYLLVVKTLIVAILVAMAIGFVSTFFSSALGDYAVFLSFLPGMLIYVFVLHYYKASVLQHILESAEIAGASFETFQIEATEYAKIQASNLLLIICSLGLLYPWAKIRAVTYLSNHISVLSRVGLDHIISANDTEQDALAEEVASMYELEVGL